MSTQHVVHLMRHGQYVLGKGGGSLTALGRRQARYAAKRLRDDHVHRTYSSDLPRACETAEIITKHLNSRAATELPMLRETTPTRVRGYHVPLESRRNGQQQIDEITARFLSAPPRAGNHLLVCHGNLIRAIVCRLLDTPVTAWTRLRIHHCGLTTIGFRKSGETLLHCFNDAGHLPHELRTQS